MNFKINESATIRKVRYEKEYFDTFEFDSFDEAVEHLVVGDIVLAFHNCGRYLMKVWAMDKDCITCTDDVGLVQFRRSNNWSKNGLVRVNDF